MRSAWFLGLGLPVLGVGWTTAEAAETGDANAWALVAASGSDRKALEADLQRWRSDALPSHGDFPKVMSSSDLAGLSESDPYVLVVALPDHEEVARRLASHVSARGATVKVEAVHVGQPEPLRVIAFDSFTASGNGAPLFTYSVCLIAQPGKCLGVDRPDDDGKLVVPFLLDKDVPLALAADVGEPWSCTAADIGPPRADTPLWLRGPTTASCVDTSGKRRKSKRALVPDAGAPPL